MMKKELLALCKEKYENHQKSSYQYTNLKTHAFKVARHWTNS